MQHKDGCAKDHPEPEDGCGGEPCSTRQVIEDDASAFLTYGPRGWEAVLNIPSSRRPLATARRLCVGVVALIDSVA